MRFIGFGVLERFLDVECVHICQKCTCPQDAEGEISTHSLTPDFSNILITLQNMACRELFKRNHFMFNSPAVSLYKQENGT